MYVYESLIEGHIIEYISIYICMYNLGEAYNKKEVLSSNNVYETMIEKTHYWISIDVRRYVRIR
jgi:hypothetical protein